MQVLGAWAFGMSTSEEAEEQHALLFLRPMRSVPLLNIQLNICREYGWKEEWLLAIVRTGMVPAAVAIH